MFLIYNVHKVWDGMSEFILYDIIVLYTLHSHRVDDPGRGDCVMADIMLLDPL